MTDSRSQPTTEYVQLAEARITQQSENLAVKNAEIATLTARVEELEASTSLVTFNEACKRIEQLEKALRDTADYLKTQSDRLTMVLSQESWTPRRSHTEGDRNAFVSAEHTLRAVLQPKGAVV